MRELLSHRLVQPMLVDALRRRICISTRISITAKPWCGARRHATSHRHTLPPWSLTGRFNMGRIRPRAGHAFHPMIAIVKLMMSRGRAAAWVLAPTPRIPRVRETFPIEPLIAAFIDTDHNFMEAPRLTLFMSPSSLGRRRRDRDTTLC